MTRIITVEILGQEFQFRVASQREDAQDVVNYLKAKVEEAQARVKNISDHKIIMLAALDIASDYYQVKKEFEDYRGVMIEKSKRLIEVIDTQT